MTEEDEPHVPETPVFVEAEWSIPVAKVDERYKRRLIASEDARRRLVDALAIDQCQRLTCDIDLKPGGRGRYHGTLAIRADVTQTCGIMLEPFDVQIEEIVELEFWPQDQIDAWDAARGKEAEVDEETPDPEPITDDMLDIGRVLFEALVMAVDPYPRSPTAELGEISTETEEERARERPFAVLEALKKGGT